VHPLRVFNIINFEDSAQGCLKAASADLVFWTRRDDRCVSVTLFCCHATFGGTWLTRAENKLNASNAGEGIDDSTLTDILSGNEHNLFDQLRILYDCLRENRAHYAAIDKIISSPWAIGRQITIFSKEPAIVGKKATSEQRGWHWVFSVRMVPVREKCSMYWLERFVNI